MLNFVGAFVCIILITVSSVLEKSVINNYNYLHFSFSRVFYMLLIALLVMIIIEPSVISSKEFHKSMKDGGLIFVGIITSLGMLLYYWLLKSHDLYIVTLIWPLVMILSIICAYFFLKESITWQQWIGVIITFIGLSITLLYKKL